MHVADVEALDEERAAVEDEDPVVVLLRAEHQLERVGEEERHAERADQGGDARRVAQGPVGEALDGDAEDGAADHAAEHHQREQEPDRHRRIARAAEHLEHAEADERADHEDVAVGEVQELEDTVDEGVAKRDQRVGAALGQAVERELGEGVQRRKASLTAEGGPGISPGPPSDRAGRRSPSS